MLYPTSIDSSVLVVVVVVVVEKAKEFGPSCSRSFS